jgi:hypothetical protein
MCAMLLEREVLTRDDVLESPGEVLQFERMLPPFHCDDDVDGSSLAVCQGPLQPYRCKWMELAQLPSQFMLKIRLGVKDRASTG